MAESAPDTAVPPRREVVLRDGRSYILRPLGVDDTQLLRDFFYSHTPETIYRRYGFIVRDMTQARAHHLVGVDQTSDLALAILEFTPGGHERIHAVGRYFLDPGGMTAEFAVVVREDKRRLGMAGLVLGALRETAAARGLHGIWGQVDRDNLPMVALMRRVGATTQPPPGVGPEPEDAPSAAAIWWLPAPGANAPEAHGWTDGNGPK